MKTLAVVHPEEFRGNLHETAGAARTGDLVSQMPGPQQAGEKPFTYHQVPGETGRHWFSAEHDGDEVGHAYVIERQGPGSPHVEIKELWTNPHYRGRGIGSRLLSNVGEHFKGHELRLKPYPIDEAGQDEGDLREFYSNRGFADYQLTAGDPFELYDYMAKPPSSGPAAEPAGVSSVYLHGGPNRVEPGDVIHQDAMPDSHGRLKHNFFTTSREVAEDAADMRDGLGHGWIHTVEPAGPFEPDPGEPDSWKSGAPLRVISVEPGRMNGTTPHPPVPRQQKTATAGSLATRAPAPPPSGPSETTARHAQVTATSPDKAKGAGGPRAHRSVDFPDLVAPVARARPRAGPPRAAAQASLSAARRAL
jgi:GNAT superfamily N-acetyltransferase